MSAKFIAIPFFLLGIVFFVISILMDLYRQERIKNASKSRVIDDLQAHLLEKIRTKIELTDRSQKHRHKDDLIADYIYRQDVVHELGDELKSIYVQEYSVLRTKYPQLTDLDLLVLCLLWMELTNEEICEVVHMERRTLYRRRQLISQRIGISSVCLEEFATNFFVSFVD